MRNIYMLISQGIVYRDLVRLGAVDHLVERYGDIRLIILTQASLVPEVIEELRHDRIVLAHHDLYYPSPNQSRLINLRRKLNNRVITRLFLKLEELTSGPPVGLRELFARYPPTLVVSSHTKVIWEWDVITWARRCRIPTAGLVKSWDNVLKRLCVRVDFLGVWSKANKRETIQYERYGSDRVEIIGPLPFDRYFSPDVIRPRDEFWRSQGLDPARPIILFGTAGGVGADWDETFMLDLLLRLVETRVELQGAQIVCRLHPISHLEHFWKYKSNPRVHLSFGSYVKTLGWSMTRGEVDEMANFLRHSDVVVTPASTLVLEAACLDSSTIVTFFSTVLPERMKQLVQAHWLDLHFGVVTRNDWVPVARDPEMLVSMLVRCISDPGWYHDGRKCLVEEYITHTDGKSFERFGSFIDRVAVPSIGNLR